MWSFQPDYLTTVILARQLIYYTKERKQGRRIAIAPRARTEIWCRSKNITHDSYIQIQGEGKGNETLLFLHLLT
jgi:hypothetical protein